MKWILHSCLYCYFEQAHFVMFSGLLFIRFVEAVVCFCKDENIAIYIFIHTIQPFFFFFNSKLTPIFAPICLYLA